MKISAIITALVMTANTSATSDFWSDTANSLRSNTVAGDVIKHKAFLGSLDPNKVLAVTFARRDSDLRVFARQLCVPLTNIFQADTSTIGSASFDMALRSLAGMQKHIAAYLQNDEITPVDLMLRYKAILADQEQTQMGQEMMMTAASGAMSGASSLKSGNIGGGIGSAGGALKSPDLSKYPNLRDMRSANPAATVIPMVQEQSRVIAAAYPGSTLSCIGGIGTLQMAHVASSFKNYRPWQIKTTSGGLTINSTRRDSGWLLDFSLGSAAGQQNIIVELQESGEFRIVTVNLDAKFSGTASVAAARTGERLTTSTNTMTTDLEGIYRADFSKTTDVSAFCERLLIDPFFRKSLVNKMLDK